MNNHQESEKGTELMYGKLINYEQVKQKIKVNFEHKTVIIQVINENVFNIFVPFQEENRYSKAIESLEIKPCQLRIRQTDDYLELLSPKLTARIYDEFKVDFYDASTGQLLCEDYRGERQPFIRQGNDRIAEAEGHQIQKNADRHQIEVLKTMFGDESFYGLGDKTGHLNKKGYAYEMWNTDDPTPHVESHLTLYKSIPFFMTLRQECVFGIFFDNTYKTYFDMGKENVNYYYFGCDHGNLDYYFIYGSQPTDIMAEYTALTGKTPLPQKWTLGYQQSRFSYATEERVEALIHQFRTLDIPCDVIHLDIHHMDAFKVFTFHPEKFPNPKRLIEKALEAGIKLVPIVDPGVKKERGYDVYEEGLKHGYFATDRDGLPYVNQVWPGDALYPDFSDPNAREWWGDHFKKLVDLGVQGIWTDMNEPSGFKGPLPDDVQFNNEGRGANHLEIHNVYGHLMSKATYSGMKKLTNKRPFVITRAAYAGTQKYSTVWTGDNQSFWDHLRLAIPQQLNLGMSGFSIVGTDVGGFGFDTTKELLCRWVQVGCFSPLFRNHTQDHTRDQEPWAFDEETLDINRKFIKLRYKLLPYFYDLLWQGERTGLPVMRPLVLHYPQDPSVKEMNDQFLVGEQLLVAPVVTQGATYRAIYLPEGIWFDYETLECHEGGQIIIKDTPLNVCPIYVKAGSILPNDVPKQYVDEFISEILILDVYPGEGGYDHIEDDGLSFDYQEGQYNHYQFVQKSGSLVINPVQMNYAPHYREFKIIYHEPLTQEVYVNGKSVPFTVSKEGIEFSVPNKHLHIEFK